MHRAGSSQFNYDERLIDGLRQPGAFRHSVSTVEIIQTHISWLILTDDYVYKIKKPIKLDFLDFSTLERRKFFCNEEIRLNQPWAPSLYIGVVPITIEGGQPLVDGSGEAIEFAVRMRRFAQALRLDQQLEAGVLTVPDMQELAANIASRHSAATIIAVPERARVLRLTRELMEDNFPVLEKSIDAALLERLREWTDRELEKKQELLEHRFDNGMVRDCHGDLHLENLVRLADGITSFDCIEFNDDLRHIDVMCDVGFLVMDLAARNREDLAAHFLNRYLEISGDYEGVAVLDLFFVYRCLVRAKVAVILSQERMDAAAAAADLEEALFYCDLAGRRISAQKSFLLVMHGFSGCGKTWVSGQLMASLPAIRLRSDIERKRIFGVAENQSSQSGLGAGIYSEDAGRVTYERLFELARPILESGHSVILDAAFLAGTRRAQAVALGRECDCPVVIVDVQADRAAMEHRLAMRQRNQADASEADVEVLTNQATSADALTSTEKEMTVGCDNSREFDLAELVCRIAQCGGSQQGSAASHHIN
jgi:aminoglycoside phosphotransferase family enzyme/predicted kinase